jgi:hypothetical protein
MTGEIGKREKQARTFKSWFWFWHHQVSAHGFNDSLCTKTKKKIIEKN